MTNSKIYDKIIVDSKEVPMEKKILVKLDNVSKKFSQKYIIKNLSLDIYEGEFLTLLGASGCGKTTVLRLISGLDQVTEGKVYIDGVDVTNLDPTQREVNTIFQNFALFPHMTVKDNVAFGLKMKKVSSEEIEKRVKKAIKLVKLEGYETRYPSELSGGQQQRVAIARGIVMNPKVLLLDESLCSLDLKLKRQMQIELKKIQKKLGITFIYVTHDQDEALTMSDRIVIINKGIIEQNDTPKNIYKNPNTKFVADFIGESNIFEGVITSKVDNHAYVSINDDLTLIIENNNDYKLKETLNLMIRPEDIKISEHNLKDSVKGVVEDYIYDGAITKLVVNINDKLKIKVTTFDDATFEENETVYLKFNKNTIVVIGNNQNEKEK